jgi:two-component system cell cycle sensor histidine kinase/response regulator CckA
MAQVLVVDDEELLRSTVRTALEERGHSVHEAANGLQALEVLAAGPIDVAVVDIVMPVMGGLQLTSEIERRFPTVQVIAVTAWDQQPKMSLLAAARDLGAEAVIPKPFTMAALCDLVDKLAARAKRG